MVPHLFVRIKFESGEQRSFLKKVLFNSNCPSLRAFLQFGFDVPYSTLKNYYSEKRLLPEKLFYDLCAFSKINPSELNVLFVDEHWGQIKGGKVSKR